MANEILDQPILHKGDNDAIPFWKIATWKNYVVLATGLTLVLLVQKALSSYLNFKGHVSRDLIGKIILDNLMGAITFALIVSAVYLFKAEYERWKSVLIFLFAGILSCIHLAFVL